MTLDEFIVALSKYLRDYPTSRVIYNLQVGKSSSVLIWDVYPEVFDDGGEIYIVVSNRHPIDDKRFFPRKNEDDK